MGIFIKFFAAAILSFAVGNNVYAQAKLKIREGDGAYGKVILTIKELKVFIGDSSYGDVIFTIDPPHIRDGKYASGQHPLTA